MQSITAIIIAGGKSSRMGTDKLLLEINGEQLIKKVVSMCNSIFPKTILITNTPEDYKFLNIKMFSDIYKNYGPLSGVHSGLVNSETETNFIISADMPFVNELLINHLLKINSAKQIILPSVENKIQPLCGIYKKSCAALAEKLLQKAKNQSGKAKTKIKLFDLINAVDTDIIDVSQEPFCHKDLFFNMNTKDDYSYVNKNFDKIMKGK